jgi:hypothetical protein
MKTPKPPKSDVPAKPADATLRRKKAAGICIFWGCKTAAGKKKLYCPKHHHREQQRTNLLGALFSRVKNRAGCRGHEWQITPKEWRAWCTDGEGAKWIAERGRRADAASLDRKDNNGPYSISNLRVIPYGANSAKHTKPDGGTWAKGDDGRYHYTLPDGTVSAVVKRSAAPLTAAQAAVGAFDEPAPPDDNAPF